MRLIDADELRKCAIPCEIHNGASTDLCVPLYQIDNAPTVDIPCNDCCADTYRDGYEKGKADARPQGEWITRHKQNSFGQDVVCFECNRCGEFKVPLYHLMITEPLEVCPNCGAKMKGGAEE